MSTRKEAIERALNFVDSGKFRERLADLIKIPSSSQDPTHKEGLYAYLLTGLQPWLEKLGFKVSIYANSYPSGGPILLADRFEDASQPTVLTYGHGDTVDGHEGEWEEGLGPWDLVERGDQWYGCGTADNKGQQAINLAALEQVLIAREGKLGFNLKVVIETSEEGGPIGSIGLQEFINEHLEELRADVLIASDGPRLDTDTPTVYTGTRGAFDFDLIVDLRAKGVHSGNWGGIIADPGIILAQALSSICDKQGKILVKEWLPLNGIPKEVKAALATCILKSEESATIDPLWGESGLSDAEKVFGWTSFIVLSMSCGPQDKRSNAVPPKAHAFCQIRFTVDADPSFFTEGLRKHLDRLGFDRVKIENASVSTPTCRTNPEDPWVLWTVESMKRSLGKSTQVIPSAGGSLPISMFIEPLKVPFILIPHSYNGCKQHGPNEHLLKSLAREGIAAFAGIWWDLGEKA